MVNLVIIFFSLPVHELVHYNCTSHSQHNAGQRQSLLSSTSTEVSSSFGKMKRESIVARIKEMMPILKVFFPLTMYWAISYQRSSTWILQGLQMDCRLGSLDIPPGIIRSWWGSFMELNNMITYVILQGPPLHYIDTHWITRTVVVTHGLYILYWQSPDSLNSFQRTKINYCDCGSCLETTGPFQASQWYDFWK